jgi:hypothetical protein
MNKLHIQQYLQDYHRQHLRPPEHGRGTPEAKKALHDALDVSDVHVEVARWLRPEFEFPIRSPRFVHTISSEHTILIALPKSIVPGLDIFDGYVAALREDVAEIGATCVVEKHTYGNDPHSDWLVITKTTTAI